MNLGRHELDIQGYVRYTEMSHREHFFILSLM